MPARGMPSLATDTPAANAASVNFFPLLVVIQEIRRGVVGHEDVRPAVVVVVTDHDAEPVAAPVEHAGLAADVGEGAVAVVAVEHRPQRREVERVAVDAELLAGVAAEHLVVHARVHVVDDEEVHVTVAIDVRPGAARTERRRPAGACRARHVGERLAPVVVEEHVRSDVGDVDVDPAVVVVVGGAAAHAVAGMRQAGGRRHVLERAVAAIVEQPVARAPRHGLIDERAAVHEQRVLPAVVVVVEEQPAAAHDFVEVTRRTGAAHVREVQAGRHGDVLELRRSRRRCRGALARRRGERRQARRRQARSESHRSAPARRSASWRARA
jgi:hypothetical protein